MTLILCIIGCIAIGWLVPRWTLRALPGRAGAILGALAALALGFGFVYGASLALAAVLGRDPRLEFEAGLNAWKLLLILAPAAALHHRRQQARGE